MKRLILITASTFATLALSVFPCLAQDTNAINEVGLVSYGSYHGGDIDQVDLKSGNLFAKIPLFSLPQLGNLSLSMSMVINNNGFANSNTCGTWTIDPDDSNGDNNNSFQETLCYPYIYRSGPIGPTLILDQDLGYTYNPGNYQTGLETIVFQMNSVTDATGAAHLMGYDIAFGSNQIQHAMDGSGYTYVPAIGNSYGAIYTPSGLRVDTTGLGKTISDPLANPGGTAPSITYSAGIANQTSGGFSSGYGWQGCGPSLSVDDTSVWGQIGSIATFAQEFEFGYQGANCPNPGAIVDSLGRQIPGLDPSTIRTDSTSLSNSGCPNISAISSLAGNQSLAGVQTWQVPGPNGQLSTYTFCYTTVGWSTDFEGGWGYAYAPANAELDTYQEYYQDTMGQATAVQAIVLPNGTYWGFVYDSIGPLVVSPNGLNPCQTTPYSTDRCNSPSPVAYGDVLEIIRPTGGSTSYTYGMDDARNAINCTYSLYNGQGGLTGYAPVGRLVQSRSINDGVGNLSTWTYRWQATGGVNSMDFSVKVTNPSVGSRSSYVNHYFADSYTAACSSPEVLTETYDLATYDPVTQTASGGTKMRSVSTEYTNNILNYTPFGGIVQGYQPQAQNFPKTVQTSIATNNGLALAETDTYSYAALYSEAPAYSINGSQTGVASTSYGTVYYEKPTSTQVAGSDGSFRNTLTNYQWQQFSSSVTGSFGNPTVNILDAPAMTCVVATSTSGPCSSVLSSAASAQAYNYGDAYNPYNLSSISQWLYGNWIPSKGMTHDSLGRVTSTTDANGNVTKILAFGTDSNTGSTTPFPSQIQRPLMPVEYYTYDDATGNVSSYTDVNGNLTTYRYDMEGRRTLASYPDGGSASYCYTDTGGSYCAQKTSPPYSVVAVRAATPSPSIVSQTLYDGLGRPVQKQSGLQAVLNAQPVSFVSGNFTSYVNTTHDSLGRVYCGSNPSFSSGSNSLQTCTTYDALNRKVVETLPDGNKLQWCYDNLQTDGQANCSSQSASNVSGTAWVDATDELGNHKQQITNGLGNLIAVMEQDPSGTNLALETDYDYDVLGNLTAVNQAGKSGDSAIARSFGYDSMSRLVWSSNPETGVICYGAGDGTATGCSESYDNNGNLLLKTDARHVQTHYTYDILNRLTAKSYSNDPSSSVTMCYLYATTSGAPGANLIGRLTDEFTISHTATTCPGAVPANGALSRRSITKYDQMGRVKLSVQCVLANCTSGGGFTLTQDYDQAGNMTDWTDGVNPETVNASYDQLGRLANLTRGTSSTLEPLFQATSLNSTVSNSTACGPNAITWAYTPAGSLQSWKLGSNLNLVRDYDTRLRPTCEYATVP